MKQLYKYKCRPKSPEKKMKKYITETKMLFTKIIRKNLTQYKKKL